jgi:protein-S-isoprenylcysteine O-methyltransferase Ste14
MSTFTRTSLTFLAGCGLFLILPLIAWGPTDLLGFVSNPARVGYMILVFVLNGFASIRSPEFGKSPRTPKSSHTPQHSVVVLLQILSIAIVLVGPFCDAREIEVFRGNGFLRLWGLALYGGGFLLMHFAQMALGKQFSIEVAIQESHTLVTSGLYRRIRHPRYLGIILFTLGISLVFRSIISSILSMLGIIVLLWRIREEGLFMSNEFGSTWQSYTEKSWKLVPFIF